MAAKKVEIDYTPDELAEIDRIINVITEAEAPQVHSPETRTEPFQDISDTESHDIEAIDEEMPSDLDIDFDESPASIEPETPDDDLFQEKSSDIAEDEIEDITDSLSDISDFEDEIPSAVEEIIPLSEDDLSFIEDIDDMGGTEDIPELSEDLTDDLMGDIAEPQEIKTSDSFSLEKDDDFDIPDLDDLAVSETSDIPEADTDDIPDIDLGDLDLESELPEEESLPEDIEDLSDAFEDIEEPAETAATVSTEPGTFDEMESFADDFDDIESIPDAFSEIPAEQTEKSKAARQENLVEDIIDDEALTIEPLDDDFITTPDESESVATESGYTEASDIELSAKDMGRLKKAIILFNPGVRQAIKETVINDLLPQAEMRKLVDMIITGKSEDSIQKFLEKKLRKKIQLVDESSQKRRVLSSRPEYTFEGRERQKRLVKVTGIFAVSTILALVVTIVSYQFIYKPYMAKKLIRQGVALIIKSGMRGGRFERKANYDQAEKLFREVDEEYRKDFIFGYNEYARAYLMNKDYSESLGKLNKAYELDRTNVDTLNNLGYFYAKTTREYFNSLKPYIKEWYFGKDGNIEGINTPLDLSINFYRRALLVDNKNIVSLMGIGNAYFYQGQYLKAKKYYEDILKIDPDSVVGYSGLLNLYIERDSFPLTATIHAELREKDMLTEIPSPLLSKLAGYYIDKRAKGDSSVRIDYGVTTPRLIDQDDNTDPAIIEVLRALNKRDPDYPQLHIQFARFHLSKHNLIEMDRYLDRALTLSPRYFSALQLKGEYYYNTKEPVKAYKFLKSALENYGDQPEFTRDEFYRETESPGKTSLYLGNIFYYYFDKVKSREGALDDEIADNDTARMENYSFAQKFYTDALNYNYTSPELYYNMGRIHYLKGEYSLSLNMWLHLYDDFVKSPELMLSLGNAFYNSGSGNGHGNYEAAKGEYLKLISVLEYEADKIRTVDLTKVSHIKIFQTLSTTYNNLGAVYQNTGEHQKRDLAYWKAIDYAQKMNQENEYARVNLARSNRNAEPILDKWIPFSIDIYREDMR